MLLTRALLSSARSRGRAAAQLAKRRLAHTGATAPPRLASSVNLSAEQQRAVALARDGMDGAGRHRATFITGGAGSGKSAAIAALKASLATDHRLLICAPTGVAALNIEGATIHTTFGMSPHDMPGQQRSPPRRVISRLRAATGLVVDEVSMVSPDLLAMMDQTARAARRRPLDPFGGLHVTFVGDFLQLPPVCDSRKNRDRDAIMPHRAATPPPGPPPKYVFQTDLWQQLDVQCVHLTTPFRQAAADRLYRLLENLRVGRMVSPTDIQEAMKKGMDLGPSTIDEFVALAKNSPQESAVKLRPMNAEVDAINNERFASLTTPSYTYQVIPLEGAGRKGHDPTLCPTTISLKTGTRVMLTRNVSVAEGLTNGACGTVVGFEPAADAVGGRNLWRRSVTDSVLPVIKFDGRGGVRTVGRVLYSEVILGEAFDVAEQLPLRQAWAITVHKSQGATLDAVDVDLRNCFEPGMAYVALSRARCFETLRVLGFHPRTCRPCPVALQFVRQHSAPRPDRQ